MRIYSAGSLLGVTGSSFPIQRTILASLSKKLASHCRYREIILPIDSEVLTIFFEWILRRHVQIDGQETMVRAWQFRREWEIPAFQNEVMRCLVDEFCHKHIDLRAMRQAYGATSSKDAEGDELLRRAFITEFAFESRDKTWLEEDLTESGLDKCVDFHRDYTRIMCLAYDYDDDYDPKAEGARIADLLVSEMIE